MRSTNTLRGSARVKRRTTGKTLKDTRHEVLAALTFEALSGANVGTWEWDIPHDIVHCCEITAKLFSIPNAMTMDGVPIRHFERTIHPDDLPRFRALLESSCQAGGIFVAEYRTILAPQDVRWILARGGFELDETGMPLHGRGIVIDITDARWSEAADVGSLFVNRPPSSEPPIHGVAEHMLEAWRFAQRLEPEAFARLKPMFEALLFEVGRKLAAELSEEEVVRAPDKAELH